MVVVMTAEQVNTPDESSAREMGPRRPGLEQGEDVLDRGVRRSAVAIDRLRARLPTNPMPIYLGVAALAAAGVVSWPVAVAAGCGYAAFRRWEPQPHGIPHPVPPPVLS